MSSGKGMVYRRRYARGTPCQRLGSIQHHQQVDVAVACGSTVGVRAEQDHPVRVELLHDLLNNAFQAAAIDGRRVRMHGSLSRNIMPPIEAKDARRLVAARVVHVHRGAGVLADGERQ